MADALTRAAAARDERNAARIRALRFIGRVYRPTVELDFMRGHPRTAFHCQACNTLCEPREAPDATYILCAMCNVWMCPTCSLNATLIHTCVDPACAYNCLGAHEVQPCADGLENTLVDPRDGACYPWRRSRVQGHTHADDDDDDERVFTHEPEYATSIVVASPPPPSHKRRRIPSRRLTCGCVPVCAVKGCGADHVCCRGAMCPACTFSELNDAVPRAVIAVVVSALHDGSLRV